MKVPPLWCSFSSCGWIFAGYCLFSPAVYAKQPVTVTPAQSCDHPTPGESCPRWTATSLFKQLCVCRRLQLFSTRRPCDLRRGVAAGFLTDIFRGVASSPPAGRAGRRSPGAWRVMLTITSGRWDGLLDKRQRGLENNNKADKPVCQYSCHLDY